MATNTWLVYSELANIGKTSLKLYFNIFNILQRNIVLYSLKLQNRGEKKLESPDLQLIKKLIEAPELKTSD